ncbi:hypothetical protein [Dehalogenimonas etheniformans]|uniref:Uncharacterized protein n=1 Tax=Dehalogenimonas etheniformans TaxID=1536648 RepID=A0A2P5P6E8_9CHLR|nr:hypothetical protein [Dehalogenimonas etheniformans]PPD57857.1 hypothetical protein JP09_006025 [Dehalogenimonas etheniformans]QNT75491.1 hypothetical protein HX448_01710 [Dehalogenimonas etheniformans]
MANNEPSESEQNNIIRPRWWEVVIVLGLVLLGLLAPQLTGLDIDYTLYLGSLYFVILLGGAIYLIIALANSPLLGERRDYRVVQFMLRLALSLGVGAVAVVVLVLLSQIVD